MISDKLTSLPADTLSHVTHTTDQQKQKPRRRKAGSSLEESIVFYEDEKGHWTGSRDSDGYAIIHWQGKTITVHRAKMELAGHDIKGKVVRHEDDNRLNASLDNLRVGTHPENMADMVARGRSRAPRPRFKATEIAYIVSKHNAGVSINQIARETGRTRKAIRHLLKRIAFGDSQMPTQGVISFTESPTPT